MKSIDALEDLEQLRAIIAGQRDTIAFQRDIIARLEGENTRLEAASTELAREVARMSIQIERDARIESNLTKALIDQVSAGGKHLVDLEQAAAIDKLAENIANFIHADKRLKQVSGNYRIYRETVDHRADEVAELDRACIAMRKDLAKSDAIYQPSEFWETFYQQNMRQLREVGLANFKLTVNQNYQNYVPRTLRDPKLKPLLKLFRKSRSIRALMSAIENPDGVTNQGYLALPGTQIFRDDPKQMALYRTMVALGWDYCRANDPLDLCPRLEEPPLGNPIRVHYSGKLISQDLATSVIEITHFLAPWKERFGEKPFSFLEVGGGYGRLAHAILSTQQVSQYFIVDIPPALHVSKWYLERLFPDKVIFDFQPFSDWKKVKSKIQKADIVFLLPHQIEAIPDATLDISTAVSSLHEMRLDQANHFLTQMGRITRHHIGSKHYWSYENPFDKIVLKQKDYILPDGFKSSTLKDDPLNPVFFIDMMERVG